MIYITKSNRETILIVDDQPTNIRILAQILDEWNLKVAKEADTALSIATNNLPDIILLDVMMPGIDGYQLCKKLKESEITKNIPIIFITAKGSETDELHGLRLGAIDYIAKPFNPDLVKIKVKNHIKYQGIRKELKKVSQAVEQSPVSIIITDISGNIEYANPKFTQLTGYSSEEIIGKNPKILRTDHHDDIYYEELWETISSGEVWKGEFYNKKKDGEKFWEEAIISPVKDEGGRIINYIAMKEDITGRKEAAEKLLAKNIELLDTKSLLNKIF